MRSISSCKGINKDKNNSTKTSTNCPKQNGSMSAHPPTLTLGIRDYKALLIQ